MRSPVVFVTEVGGADVVSALRTLGYVVVEVAANALVDRVARDKPHVIVLDVDTEDALASVGRIRKLTGSGSIDFIYIGRGSGKIRSTEEALANEGSAFFALPLELDALVRKIEALTGGPIPSAGSERRSPPPSAPSSRASSPSLPAPGLRTPGGAIPKSRPSLVELAEGPRSAATLGVVSHELSQLLMEAERRAEAYLAPFRDAPPPSADGLATPDAILTPDEEIEAVLPADVLASLDEPLEAEDSEEMPEPQFAQKFATTSGGTRPPVPVRMATNAPTTHSSFVPQAEAVVRPASASPPELARGASVEPGPLVKAGALLGAQGAARLLGEAVSQRKSGALVTEQEGVVRRIVLWDGDFVTAVSSSDDESFVAFLAARGELSRGDALELRTRVPAYGRHAGAALVAHGFLQQDQLWTSLRAHAEWIAIAALSAKGGVGGLENEAPGRLRDEPSVFGAKAGPAVFVDLVRRAISTEDALARLGGSKARLAAGAEEELIAECNLTPEETELVTKARGGTVGEVVAGSLDTDFPSLLHALALLGILEIAPAPDFARSGAPPGKDSAALDLDALRGRIRARLDLVDEGDYFALLGVRREATPYEIRRAFIELRRTFEPTEVSSRLPDLEGDAKKIVSVLEEAYEILRDATRRERYRRAIDAPPG